MYKLGHYFQILVWRKCFSDKKYVSKITSNWFFWWVYRLHILLPSLVYIELDLWVKQNEEKMRSILLFFPHIFLILFFNFTILYWFCHISTWIHHRYTRVPHPEPSSFLPPRTIPLGRPSAPAPSIQYPASNLDWRLVSYMILDMFQCHSPKSSHPLPLPESKRLFYTSHFHHYYYYSKYNCK